MLPLSHDEVVHGKGSLIDKMPGDDWQQFANLRLLLGHMWTHPGKKLLFMGGEFGQRREWNHDAATRLVAAGAARARGVQRWVERPEPRCTAPSRRCTRSISSAAGFEWIDATTPRQRARFLRKARDGSLLLVVANFTPVPRDNYLLGVPRAGHWLERLNSDATLYGGSGVGNWAARAACRWPRTAASTR